MKGELKIRPTDKFDVLVIMRLGDANVYFHLEPISMIEAVDTINIVRPLPENPHRKVSKSKYHEISSKGALKKLWQTYRTSLEIARKDRIKAIVSFTAFPYGLIAFIVGFQAGIPVHIGFVGSDWYRDCKSWYGRFLNKIFRQADLITVTGNKMKNDMTKVNYPASRIHHLPHAVNINAYDIIPPEKRIYDCLFTGHLIHRKRVDIIIQAIAILKKDMPDIKLCILGKGPLLSELKDQAISLDVEENVDFLGYVDTPENYFSNSRIVIIASAREGFPFALVEGIAAGAVPVSSDVGTICEHIENHKNGLLVPYNDVQALAGAVQKVLFDKNYFRTLQNGVLDTRKKYSFEYARDKWKQWFYEVAG